MITVLEGCLSWDMFCKALLKERPQDFLAYFVPGARFVRVCEGQLQTRLDGPREPREIRGDIVIEAEREDQPFLMGVEWQSSKDAKIDERLLGYSYEATRLHNLPMLSVVVYTRPVNDVPTAPLICSIPGDPIPGGCPALWFDFVSLDVCNQPVEEFRKCDLDGFRPLMLLCKDGANGDVLEEVLARLQESKRTEAIAATLFFAGKVLTSEVDLKRLERKYIMLQDVLKGSWTYERTIKEGREEGIVVGHGQGLEEGIVVGHEQGREEGIVVGREEGRVENARQAIEALTQARFPNLLPLIKSPIALLTDEAKLQKILLMVGTAHDAEEFRQSWFDFMGQMNMKS